MEKNAWVNVFPGAITVTDSEGTVIEMNEESATKLFKGDGGYEVLGRNAITCHPPRTREKVRRIYETHSFNIYSITKNGQKYLVYQAPYFIEEEFSGIVEMFLELPDELPHFDRDNPEK
ncbi:MAG: hypothetical protein Q7J07_05080 [Pelolinea sp.]|nr:hypothetical protein [Pelolinea sp.]